MNEGTCVEGDESTPRGIFLKRLAEERGKGLQHIRFCRDLKSQAVADEMFEEIVAMWNAEEVKCDQNF